MHNKSIRFHLITILLLLICAGGIRLFLFSGFVLGDDPAYADFVSRILKGSYPPIGSHSVFTCRPIILYAIAFPVCLFGWYDWSFVLPILLASLSNTALVYLAGNRLSGPLAGVLAALVYITFPLDAVHATTLSNDIPLSTFIWGGGLLLLYSYNKYNKRAYLLLTMLSGFIVGAAVGIKLNAVVAPAILLTTMIVIQWKELKGGGYKTPIAWMAGWLLANVLLCIFLYSLSGDFIAHYHAEMRFNLDYNPSGYFVGEGSLLRFLLYYPKLILGILKEGHYGYQFMPYGYFFICYFLCLPLVFIKRFRGILLPAFLAIVYMLIMEFTPLKLSPDYVPIHRLPRFLHIALIPSAVAIGIAFSVFATMRNRIIKVCIWLPFIVLMVTSLYWSYVKANFYKDCALDHRWAWEVVKDTSAKKIITDIEMRNYLMFRSGFKPPTRIDYPKKLPRKVPLQSLVILGGARRPDVYPGYADNWYRNSESESWLLISEAPFLLKPWRLSKLRIYQTDSTGRKKSDKKVKIPSNRKYYQRHPAIKGMRKIAELDIGNTASERRLNYSITGQSWSGSRYFSYPDGKFCEDNGKAYREVEKITLKKLIPNMPIVIVKRLDPTVASQRIKVHFQDILVGIWSPSEKGMPGHWHESTFKIPPEVVTETSGEISFYLEESDFDINSFYYWFFQP